VHYLAVHHKAGRREDAVARDIADIRDLDDLGIDPQFFDRLFRVPPSCGNSRSLVLAL
jgi:hypothetical protein